MVIWLDESAYNLAKSVDFSELDSHIRFDDSNNSIELDEEPIVQEDYFGKKFEEKPIWIMLGCISDEVVLSGLSPDQNKVLPRGRELYELYDSIYYSLPVKQ